MATTQEIAEVRVNTGQMANTEPYTDTFLGGLIDAYGVDGAQDRVWTAERNKAARLVDISEGGSSRKNSQVFDHFSKIVAASGATEEDSGRRSPRTREIERA